MGKSKKKKKHNPTHKKVQNQYNQDETFADNDELFGKSKIHSVTTLQIIQWFHGDGHERTDKSSLKSKERQSTITIDNNELTFIFDNDNRWFRFMWFLDCCWFPVEVACQYSTNGNLLIIVRPTIDSCENAGTAWMQGCNPPPSPPP